MIQIDESKYYTKKEIGKLFNYSEQTMRKTWKRTIDNLQKKGYILTQHIIDKKQYYTIKIDKDKLNNDQDLPNEKWIPVYCEPRCEVSNKGRVRNVITQKIYKNYKNPDGYLTVKLYSTNYRVHRLVKISFDPIEDPDKMTIDHLDGNRNNNTLENLEYASSVENTRQMLIRRDKIQMAITEKLKNGWSYEELLKIINNLPNK